MNLNQEILLLWFIFLFLQIAAAGRVGQPKRFKSMRRSSSSSSPARARRVPFGPMLPPPAAPGRPQRFSPKRRSVGRPIKRDEYSLSSLLLGGSLDPDFGAGDMTLDDAFKMGYTAGKTVATGDLIRNQWGQQYSQSQYAYGGGPSSPATTWLNFFFPQVQPQQPYLTYDPGFSPSLGYGPDTGIGSGYLPDSGYTPSYIPDPGFGIYDPGFATADPTYTNTIPETEDDDWLLQPVQSQYVDPGYITDVTGPFIDNTPQVIPVQDTLVGTTDPVLISSDGTITPVAIDEAGNVLVPVGNIATTPELTLSNVLSN